MHNAGKYKSHDVRTTIFKKGDKDFHNMHLKTAKLFFSEAQKKYGNLPFSLRHFKDEKKAKLGLKQCVDHDLLQPLEVIRL
jgi:hypothetical protein